MATILDRIRDYKLEEVARRRRGRPAAAIEDAARAADAPRGFERALRRAAASGYGLIAEVKKASPSKGLIRADFDPPALARAYEAGGAACLSVLTDGPSFQGHDDFLVAARAACALPAIRKDFLYDPWQVAESRALGADCVLVILATVSDAQASELIAAARSWGMDVLVEVHDRAELDRALRLEASAIGINNRDLNTFETDLQTTRDLASTLPDGCLAVSRIRPGVARRPRGHGVLRRALLPDRREPDAPGGRRGGHARDPCRAAGPSRHERADAFRRRRCGAHGRRVGEGIDRPSRRRRRPREDVRADP